MPIEIELPDGTILEAPDGADPSAVAKAYMAKRQPQQQPSLMQRAGRQAGLGARTLMEGGMDIVSPWADLLGYGLNKALPGDPFPYKHSEAFSGALTEQGVPAPASGSEKFSNTAGRILTGAGLGGLADDAITGAAGLARRATPSASTPSTQQLKDLSRQAYQQAENAGVVVAPQRFADSVKSIVATATKEGIDPTLHPQATAALRRLTNAAEAGEPIAMQQLEILRKVAKGAAGSLSKDERRISRIIVDALDDFALNLKETDVIAGEAGKVGRLLKEARGLWSRASKSEVVEELIERATNRASQFSGSGYENAMRTEFRNLVQNPKRLRLFTPVEQQALQRVARGGPIENVLRYFGKLAPTGVVSGALGSGIGAAVGTALGGPVGGVIGATAIPVAGASARQGATMLTSRNARLASELMRRGGPAASVPLSQALAPTLPYALGATPAASETLMRLLLQKEGQ